MERLAPMRRWAFLLMYAVNNDIAEGRFDQAIEKNLTVIQMAKHMRQQPTDIDIMVGFAIEDLGLGGINNFLVWSDANESHLGKIEKAISAIRYDLNSDLPNFIALDKLRLKIMYGGLFYEINSKGKVRLSRDPWAVIRESLEEELERGEIQNPEDEVAMQKFLNPPGFWKKRYRKLRIILMWFFVPEIPEKMDRIVNESYEKLHIMDKPDFDWSKEPQEVRLESLFQFRLNFRRSTELMAESEESIYFRLHDVYIQQSAKHRGTLLIIALKRYKNNYGKWPDSLDSIKSAAPAEAFIDPVTGNQLQYENHGERFSLYGETANIWPK